MEKKFEKEIEVCLALVREAVFATERIRKDGIMAVDKEDGSPVTQADIVSQAILLRGIERSFPKDRILAEEEFSMAEKGDLVERACGVLEDLRLPCGPSRLKEWVNYRGNPRGERLWMIDPIDGTKGYRKGLCYAVAMGLYFEGRPRFGCMAVPLFPGCSGQGKSIALAYAGAGRGAFLWEGGEDHPRRIHVSRTERLSDFKMIGSRVHDREGLNARFMQRGGIRQLQHMDGEGKYLMVASGEADLLLRSAGGRHGIGFPWDHCAGHVILEEAGGKVTTASGGEVNYVQVPEGAPIKDLEALVASNGRCHEEVLDLLREVL
jgi:3'(2'), 5'-bisphosphate nucleotidase